MELRQQIVEKFAERNLKSLLNDKVFNQFRKTISNEVDAAITAQLGRVRRNGWRREVSISAEIREAISKAVDEAATAAITERFEEVCAERLERYERYVDNRLRKALDKAFDEKQIESLVEQRVQQRLALAASFNRNGKEERAIDLD